MVDEARRLVNEVQLGVRFQLMEFDTRDGGYPFAATSMLALISTVLMGYYLNRAD